MSFSMPTFDTHYYVKLLEAAGFNAKQAEAQVKFQAEILDSAVENKIVTKEVFKESIAMLDSKMITHKTELELKIIEFKTALEFKIAEVKADLESKIAEVKRDVHLMKWMLSFICSSMIAVLIKLFLH